MSEEEQEKQKCSRVKLETNWPNVLFFIYLHMCAAYGLFLVFTQAYLKTTLFSILLVMLGTLGVTTGCHRLWAHRTYNAVWPLRLLLITLHTLVCQGSVYDWVLDHRIHHKYHGTDSDCYNYKRGFTFSQIGCRCVTYKTEIADLSKEIDTSDVEADPLVMYQKKLYWIIMPIVSLLLPFNAPVEYWNESILVSIFVVGFLRITILLHCAWLINSAFIVWGLDPLNKRATDTNLIFVVTKSLWPQYHYILPWDYKSGEYGTYGSGCSTAFIRVWAALGLAYNLRSITTEGVKNALAEAADSGRPVVDCLNEAQTISTMADVLDRNKHKQF
ncbi:acyl-CoA Delta-9 desaturase-like [Lycorma delicatula]|uniref:acyl-CoA Delta-9 desaturase-like n=1 Tax=Lycorma delicatula TaxID=130591 RepID=UPI003F51A751